MATRRLRALARHLATRDADSQLAVVPAAKATAVVAAVDQNEAPAEMSDTEKFLWDLQGVSFVATFGHRVLISQCLVAGWSLTVCNGDVVSDGQSLPDTGRGRRAE